MRRGKALGRLFIISIIALLLISRAAFADTPLANPQCILTGATTTPENCIVSAFPYMAIGILVSFLIISFVYMLGKVLNYSPMQQWFTRELWETIKTLILVGIIISTLIALGAIASSLAGVSPTTGGTISNNLGNLYNVADSVYLDQSLINSYNAYASVAGLSAGYGVIDSATLTTWFPAVPIPFWIGTFVIVGSVQFGSTIPIYAGDYIYANSGDPSSGFSLISLVNGLIVTPLIIIMQTQYDLFYTIVDIGLGILIPIGIILRAIPVFRNVGGTFIGIGIGVAIIYPSLLVLFNLPIYNYMYSFTSAVNSQTPACGTGSLADLGNQNGFVCTLWSGFVNLAELPLTGVTTAGGAIVERLAFGTWANGAVIANFTRGVNTGIFTPLSSSGAFPSLNLIIDQTLVPIMQFLLLTLDLMAGYILTSSIAGLLGGKITLGIGSYKLI